MVYLLIAYLGASEDKSKEYKVTVWEKALYKDWSTTKSIEATSASEKNKNDMGISTVLSHGTKTINGIKVYYLVYKDSTTWADDSVHESVEGTLFFKKNGEWAHITWTDAMGNPNKALIEKEISDKINSI